ncbi:MAG: aryl-sulfate sulfotransferase [Candidatus Kapabacteria bacterium]|nr:aryl-sulfate sulfotransferase [Candidatus Kapabacteria bacterium]
MKLFYTFVFLYIDLIIGASSAISSNLIDFEVNSIDNPAPGYIFIGPTNGPVLSIYDNSGKAAFTKDFSSYGNQFIALRLLEDSSFAFFSIDQKKWIILDKNLNILDSIVSNDAMTLNFHTIHISPQGNYLVASDNPYMKDMSHIVTGGDTSAIIQDIWIYELDRTNKSVLFQWKTGEHIDLTEATEDISLLSKEIDAYHLNTAIYDIDGNIFLNFRNLDEIIKINRSTGEIIWKMGGTKSRANQFTFTNDTYNGFTGFSHQHNPHRLANGHILLYDNGVLKPTKFSRAVEYKIDEENKTATKVWEFRHSPDIFSSFMGSATRLINGNTIIGWGLNTTNRVATTEIDSNAKISFEMSAPEKSVFYQSLRNCFIMDAVFMDISSKGLYNFNNNKNTTGIKIDIDQLTGSGFISVEKHAYQPYNISYKNTPGCQVLPYRWVISKKSLEVISSQIQFDLTNIKSIFKPEQLRIFKRSNEGFGSFELLQTNYNSQLNVLEVNSENFGEFIIASISLNAPTLLYPENNSDSISPNSLSLIWEKSTTDVKFRVQISSSENFDNVVKDTIGITSNSLLVKSLSGSTKYFWRVCKLNDNCVSNWSEINIFNTGIGSPEPIFPVNNSSAITLTPRYKWSKINDVENYQFQVSLTEDFLQVIYEFVTVDTSHHQKNFLNMKTIYYWRVRAFKNGLSGLWTSASRFTTNSFKINLRHPENKYSGLEPSGTLIWDSIPGITNYEIKIYKDSTCKKLQTEATNLNISEYNYKDFDHSTRYYWRVRGKSKDTTTLWSEIWQYKIIAGIPNLILPDDKSQNVASSGVIKWDTVPNGLTYRIQVARDSAFKFMIIDKIISMSSYNYNNLYYNSTFYWRVHTYDGETIGNWSAVRSFSTNPQLVYPSDDEYKVPVNATFTWHPVPHAIGYNIQIADDILLSMNSQTFYQDGTDTNFNCSGLNHNQSYYWSIKPQFSNSYPTYWLKAFKLTTSLEKPESLLPTDDDTITINKIEILWKSSDQAETYWLQVARDEDFNNIIIENKNIIDNSFKVDLIGDGLYFWRVSSLNGKNGSEWTSARKFIIRTDATSDVKKNDDINSKITCIPNYTATSSLFEVTIAAASEAKLSIFDVNGKKQATIFELYLTLGIHRFEFNTEFLTSGINLYELDLEGKKLSGKMTLIK